MERLNHVAHSHFLANLETRDANQRWYNFGSSAITASAVETFTLMTHDFASHLADEIAVGVSQNVVLLHLDLMKRCADLADAAVKV